MSPQGVALTGGSVSRRDIETFEQLESNRRGELETVRKRAEKWIGGLTALTGVLTTALVLGGPDKATSFTSGWRIWLAAFVAIAFVLLLWSTRQAYSSAYGDLGKPERIDTRRIEGLAARYDVSRHRKAQAAMKKIQDGITGAILAVVLLLVAIGMTWFIPTTPSGQETHRSIGDRGRSRGSSPRTGPDGCLH